jgi:hypothetical protein
MPESEQGLALLNRSTDSLSTLGYVYALCGRVRDARVILDEVKARVQRGTPPYWAAVVAVGLDDPDQAFALLEDSYARRDPFLPWIVSEPRFRHIRSDPRYDAIVSRLGV